jgi:hypothetical protein
LVAVADVEGCWFCGRPRDERCGFRVGLHRDVESKNYAVVVSDQWQRRGVVVPRCRRCRVGHGLETVLLVIGIPAIAWGAGLLIDGLTGAAGADPLDRGNVVAIAAFALPLLAWVALVLGLFGLRRRRYVRRHPAVADLLDDGWRYGGAPIYHFDKRWTEIA